MSVRQIPASVMVCKGIIRYNRRRLTQTARRIIEGLNLVIGKDGLVYGGRVWRI